MLQQVWDRKTCCNEAYRVTLGLELIPALGSCLDVQRQHSSKHRHWVYLCGLRQRNRFQTAAKEVACEGWAGLLPLPNNLLVICFSHVAPVEDLI